MKTLMAVLTLVLALSARAQETSLALIEDPGFAPQNVCFGVAAQVPSDLLTGEDRYLWTGATLCVRVGQMKNVDVDGIYQTGNFRITVRDAANKTIASRIFNAVQYTNVAGHAYQTYGLNLKIVQNAGDHEAEIIRFDLMTRPVRRGFRVGSVIIGSTELTLIQK